jgi:uncharacterized repeat protein (TIGR02543 family)
MKNLKLVLLVLLLSILVACGDSYDPEINGVPPVYQGMEVVNSNGISSTNNQLLSESYEFSQDISDSIPTIDIPEQADVTYYSNPNEEILIRVTLFNPDGQVILRLIVNNVTYQIAQFESGSNSELIIIKVNVGSESGLKSITIDELKYIENVSNDIKDAVFLADRTINIGVTYQNLINARLLNETITEFGYQALINISDNDNLINTYQNNPVLYLFDGESIVYTQSLNVGNNIINITDLKPSALYEYAIASTYDLLDSKGVQSFISLNQEFQTSDLISIKIDTITKDTVNFSYSNLSNLNQTSITSYNLYRYNQLVTSTNNVTSRTFTDLLANNDYELEVNLTYTLNQENFNISYRFDFNTESYFQPEVDLLNFKIYQDKIDFEIDFLDIDNLGSITKIAVLNFDTVIFETTDTSINTIGNLNPNSDYRLIIYYVYDVKDGRNMVASEYIRVFTTPLINGLGTVDNPYEIWTKDDLITLNQFSQGYVSLKDDIDLSGENWTPLEYFNGQFNGNMHTIYGLTLKGNYFNEDNRIGLFKVFVGEIINLNVKDIDIDIVTLHALRFGVLTAETADHTSLNLNNIHITGNINIRSVSESNIGGAVGYGFVSTDQVKIDLDFNVITDSNIYFGGILSHGRLTSNASYFRGNVNLDASIGVISAGGLIGNSSEVSISDSFSSIHLDVKGFEEKRLGGLVGYVHGKINIEKTFTTGYIGNINSNDYTYSGGIIGYFEGQNALKTFSDTISTINIFHTGYHYAGNIYGVSRGGVLFNNVYRTENQYIHDRFNTPFETNDNISAISSLDNELLIDINTYNLILNWNSSLFIMSYTFELFNPIDFTITSSFDALEYTLNTQLINQEQYIVINQIEFYNEELLIYSSNFAQDIISNLLSNQLFDINLIYSIYNDNQLLSTYNINLQTKTLAKEIPTVGIINVSPTQESISFELDVKDTDDAGSLTSIELYQGDILIESLTDLTQRTFENLLSNNEYQIKVTYTYDLMDGKGTRFTEEMISTYTLMKEIPIVEISQITSSQDSISIKLNIEDSSLTVINTEVSLFKNDDLIETISNILDLKFVNLDPVSLYEITYKIQYDLNDGNVTKTIALDDSIPTLGYTIHFNTNGGYEIDSFNESIDNLLVLPDASKIGHTFVGWYRDSELTIPFEQQAYLTSDIVIYAKWTINSYTLNINSVQSSVSSVHPGPNHAFAITTDKQIYAWGINEQGQLGSNTYVSALKPINITNNFDLYENEYIIDIATGENHAHALTNFGRVFAWGLGHFGVLGNNLDPHGNVPFDITSYFNLLSDENIVSIKSSGNRHTAALSSNGRVFVWGQIVGDGSGDEKRFPKEITNRMVLDEDDKVIMIHVGYYNGFAVTEKNKVFAWGDNFSGQLGDGTSTFRSTPVLTFNSLPLFPNENIINIFTVRSATFIKTDLNRFFAYGDYQNYFGLVNENLNVQEVTNNFSFLNSEISKMSGVLHHMLLLTNDGNVYSSGSNDNGQLGSNSLSSLINNGSVYLLNQTFESPNEFAVDIFTSLNSSFILTNQGNLYAFGKNHNGQLATGNYLDQDSPKNITFINDVLLSDTLEVLYNANLDFTFGEISLFDNINLYIDSRLRNLFILENMPNRDLELYVNSN